MLHLVLLACKVGQHEHLSEWVFVSGEAYDATLCFHPFLCSPHAFTLAYGSHNIVGTVLQQLSLYAVVCK